MYPLYFETHEYAAGLDGFSLNFEISDFQADRGGTITLTDVEAKRHDLLP
jgi:hypothetical protein